MKNLCYMLVLVAGLMACEEEAYFPPGLYAAQVEHLLTGGDKKAWYLSQLEVDGQRQELEGCSELLELHFISNDETIEVYELSSCTPQDSIYYGEMSASVASASTINKNLFTDSLLFEGGTQRYFLVRDITSLRLRFDRYASGVKSTFWYYSEPQ